LILTEDRRIPTLDEYEEHRRRHLAATAEEPVFVLHPQTLDDLEVALILAGREFDRIVNDNLGEGLRIDDIGACFPDSQSDIGVIDTVRDGRV
jgi:hypothetical protein